MSDISLTCTVQAPSYGEAIEQFGAYVDKALGPSWKLTYARASALQIRTGTGDLQVLTWEWDMKAERVQERLPQ